MSGQEADKRKQEILFYSLNNNQIDALQEVIDLLKKSSDESDDKVRFQCGATVNDRGIINQVDSRAHALRVFFQKDRTDRIIVEAIIGDKGDQTPFVKSYLGVV